MIKRAILSMTMGLFIVISPIQSKAVSEESIQSTGDTRQLVSMPEQSRELMMLDMLDHLSAITEIIGYLAENNFDAVAEVAESRMGKSSTGKHRGTGMGPGRFMPIAMRNVGWTMHESASELSRIAKEGDLNKTFAALQKVTAACAKCHYSYRVR